jgi:hypothetical protein
VEVQITGTVWANRWTVIDEVAEDEHLDDDRPARLSHYRTKPIQKLGTHLASSEHRTPHDREGRQHTGQELGERTEDDVSEVSAEAAMRRIGRGSNSSRVLEHEQHPPENQKPGECDRRKANHWSCTQLKELSHGPSTLAERARSVADRFLTLR